VKKGQLKVMSPVIDESIPAQLRWCRGYQTLINEALRTAVGGKEQPLTPETVRRIVREELALQG
jgi:hypothetical protein